MRKAAGVGALLAGGGQALFFAVLYGVIEPLRGYAVPDWDHGGNAATMAVFAATVVGAVAGAIAGGVGSRLRNR